MAVLPNAFSEFGADAPAPDDAAASFPQPPADAAADFSDHEIFVGALKLRELPDDIDQQAYPPEDRLLFDVLEALCDPSGCGIPRIPDEQAFAEAIEPPPLFLQQAAGF